MPTPTPTPTPAAGSATGTLSVAPPLLYVAENQQPTIDFYDPKTLVKLGSFTDISTTADPFALPSLSPLAVARDKTGNVYVSDRNGYVRKYAAGAVGNIKPIAAFSGAKSCFTSYCPNPGLFGVAVDRKNRVIAVGDDGSSPNNIVIFAQTTSASMVQTPTQIVVTSYSDFTVQLDGLAVDAGGNLFATDLFTGSYAFNAPIPSSTATMSSIVASRRITSNPSFPIAVDAAGDVFVGYAPASAPLSAGSTKIAIYPPTSNAPILLDFPANAGVLDGLAADATGHLYASFAGVPPPRDGSASSAGQLSLLARYDLNGATPATAQAVVTLSIAPNGISL